MKNEKSANDLIDIDPSDTRQGSESIDSFDAPLNPIGVEASSESASTNNQSSNDNFNSDNASSSSSFMSSELRSELAQLKGELDSLLSHAASLTERELADAHARLMMKFGSLRALARTVASNAGERLQHGKEITYERVRTHPMQSMAIAAGAGVIMGLAMRRH